MSMMKGAALYGPRDPVMSKLTWGIGVPLSHILLYWVMSGSAKSWISRLMSGTCTPANGLRPAGE